MFAFAKLIDLRQFQSALYVFKQANTIKKSGSSGSSIFINSFMFPILIKRSTLLVVLHLLSCMNVKVFNCACSLLDTDIFMCSAYPM